MRLDRFSTDYRNDVGDLDLVIELRHCRDEAAAYRLARAIRDLIDESLGNNVSKRRGW